MPEYLESYLLWNLVGFLGAFVVNSFVEWGAHRFILHSDAILKFAYQLHDVQHHNYFKADETYKADPVAEEDKWRMEHIDFVPRDYLLFILVTSPIWLAAEFLAGVPLAFGGAMATLAGLQLFNSMHHRYHVKGDSWFQRTWFFRFLCEHHRIHHAYKNRNLNVATFPLADLCLGTLLLKEPASTESSPGSDHPVPERRPEPIPADKEAPR